MLQLPLIILFQQHRADQPDDRCLVGEDPDNVGASLHLLVQPFQRIRAVQLGPVLLGEVQMRQHVGLAVVDERRELRPFLAQLIGYMKAALARLGIRGFKPELRKAAQQLESLHTPEESPIPPNTLDELRRDLARLAILRGQIIAIEQTRLERLEQAPHTGANAMIRLLASVIGVGIETADMRRSAKVVRLSLSSRTRPK